MIRVAGLDLSLTSAGIARCTVDGDRISTHAQAIATGSSGKGIDGRWLRLNWLAGKLADAVGVPHLVLIEAPTYSGTVTGSAHDRAGLWWLTIDRIMQAAPLADVVEVHPSHLKIYATGNVTLRRGGKLHHIGIGKEHARTPIRMLINDLHVIIVNKQTGEILRELTIDPTKNSQPRGLKPGPKKGSPARGGRPKKHPN